MAWVSHPQVQRFTNVATLIEGRVEALIGDTGSRGWWWSRVRKVGGLGRYTVVHTIRWIHFRIFASVPVHFVQFGIQNTKVKIGVSSHVDNAPAIFFLVFDLDLVEVGLILGG